MPSRSCWSRASKMIASSSSEWPIVPPAPAVFSISNHVSSAHRSSTCSSAGTMRARPASKPAPRCEPMWKTTPSAPIAHAVSVRVRMAPSPTGALHVGGVRTALFNWLFARNQGGEFLLRVENTDINREVEGAVEHAIDSLTWLGLDWDRPPSFQLDAMPRCVEVAHRLVADEKAYEDEGAIRFRMPDEGVTAWDDVVKGRIEFPNEQLDDLVILRSDGRPTYNFASPMEDVWDEITHVIRGDDHISNTPRQINIIRAVGAEPPIYAHVPNVLGTDGKKLSKRHGATGVDELRAQGYYAPALMNFLALLGWSYDDKTTIMSGDELIERFTLERVVPS